MTTDWTKYPLSNEAKFYLTTAEIRFWYWCGHCYQEPKPCFGSTLYESAGNGTGTNTTKPNS